MKAPEGENYVPGLDPFPLFCIFIHDLSQKAVFTQSRENENGDKSSSVRIPRSRAK
jgi:hypothetical protein